MFALLCHGRLAQYCCMVCPRFFVFVFSFVIVLVFVLTERSAIVLVFVFVFVTKIALADIGY